jgi:hypothetical protein
VADGEAPRHHLTGEEERFGASWWLEDQALDRRFIGLAGHPLNQAAGQNVGHVLYEATVPGGLAWSSCAIFWTYVQPDLPGLGEPHDRGGRVCLGGRADLEEGRRPDRQRVLHRGNAVVCVVLLAVAEDANGNSGT